MKGRIVFHIDFDYFYAQCEEIRTPELKPKPVCVCVFSGRGGDSGAIATANYTARKYGAKSGMPITFAKRRLKDREDAVFLPVDFRYYSEVSEKAMDTMRGYADVFEYVGRDEAYLDVTDRVECDFKRAGHLAQQIKNAVRHRAGISCSVGISPNKMVSKIASNFQKPDGITVVRPDGMDEFLGPLKIRAIPGIGKKTEKRLLEMGLETVQDLRKRDIFVLNKEFGRKSGAYIFNAARGEDEAPVKEREASVQYSKIATLSMDSRDYQFLRKSIVELCGEVHKVAMGNNRMFKSVGVQLIHSDLSGRTKSKMLKNPTSSLAELQRNAERLLAEALDGPVPNVRRLGVRVSDLSEMRGQMDITGYF